MNDDESTANKRLKELAAVSDMLIARGYRFDHPDNNWRLTYQVIVDKMKDLHSKGVTITGYITPTVVIM